MSQNKQTHVQNSESDTHLSTKCTKDQYTQSINTGKHHTILIGHMYSLGFTQAYTVDSDIITCTKSQNQKE